MFSSFPDGWPGVGLSLLRAMSGGALIAQGIAYIAAGRDSTFFACTVAIFAGASGLLLVVGYLTPIASVASIVIYVGGALSWISAPSLHASDINLATAFATTMSISIICLGPGAFSIDAHLFGRREIIIPDTSRLPKS
jgi:uncharacterized membrane protein YphA (DoxX/SURF4 family)